MSADRNLKELQRFGVTVGIVVAGLFGAVLPWLFGHSYPLWPWVAGGILVVWGLIYPAGLKPVYRGWMIVGNTLGWINSRIILGIAFLAIILPTAVVMRLARRDPLARALEKDRRTYRVPSANPPKKHFERPF